MAGSDGFCLGSVLMLILWRICTAESEGGVRYSINDHAVQIFRIVEDTAHAMNGIEITMEPSYFYYLVPFTTTLTCADGTMDVSGMEHTHVEDSYMEAINETHSYLQAKFAVADLSYKYDFCWLNFGVPIPIWLRGKVLHSEYFVSAFLRYEPKCQVDIQRAQLLSYGRLTVNIFQWMPGVIGDWLMDAITRNAQDRIFATVEKSIKTNAEALTETYDPCIVFLAMGKMKPHAPDPDIDSADHKDETFDTSRYIGGLLDEISGTEKSSESENDSEIEATNDTEDTQKNDSENEAKNESEDKPKNYSKSTSQNDSKNDQNNEGITEGIEKNDDNNRTEL